MIINATKHEQMRWQPSTRESSIFDGRWVALVNCRHDGSHRPVEGDVVDSDKDLAELCGRLHEASQSKCIILYCESRHAADTVAESARGHSIRLLA